MIAVAGDDVVHLGGWRGDRLSLGRAGAPFRPLADLGWDAARQTTPQRRLRIVGEAVVVLEPVEGPELVPPLRVRRFDFDGRETDRVEGPGEPGAADWSFLFRRRGETVTGQRCGVDPDRLVPTLWEGAIAADVVHARPDVSGSPLRQGGAWWYPIRMEGILRLDDAGAGFSRGEPGPIAEIGGRAVCGGMRDGQVGLWIDGDFRPLGSGRLFPEWRAPLDGLVAAHGGGLALLRADGGGLWVHEAPPARLPRGVYAGLVAPGGRLHGLALGPSCEPQLVPAVL